MIFKWESGRKAHFWPISGIFGLILAQKFFSSKIGLRHFSPHHGLQLQAKQLDGLNDGRTDTIDFRGHKVCPKRHGETTPFRTLQTSATDYKGHSVYPKPFNGKEKRTYFIKSTKCFLQVHKFAINILTRYSQMQISPTLLPLNILSKKEMYLGGWCTHSFIIFQF